MVEVQEGEAEGQVVVREEVVCHAGEVEEPSRDVMMSLPAKPADLGSLD